MRRSILHEVVYMKTDYEPWWMFDDWQDEIVSRQEFSSAQQAHAYLTTLINDFDLRFSMKEKRAPAFFCYWNEEELEYCEKCEEELQVFHGLIWLENGKPRKNG